MSIKPIASLIKGPEVLAAFSHRPSGLKLPEVVRLTGFPKATAYRIVQTLVGQGYLHYFPSSGILRLGPRVMSLGFSALSSLDLVELAEPYLIELSSKTDQNVNLGVLDGTEVVYLIRRKRRRILGIDLTVGSRLGAHNTAIGQAILAFLERRQLEDLIARLARKPESAQEIGPGGQRLLDRLQQVRRQGYALCDQELVPGLISVGVPVFGNRGKVEAAINMPVFSQLCDRERLLNEYLPQVQEVATALSTMRGHDPEGHPDQQVQGQDDKCPIPPGVIPDQGGEP
ncbi:MAG: IclR family transcriptional regulator [Deltaproteobacteria bacterium]|nr:IclR family transcriptional regulator [Deltaproteobacteria bacterium]